MDEPCYDEDCEDEYIDDEEEISFDGYDRRGWRRLDDDGYDEDED